MHPEVTIDTDNRLHDPRSAAVLGITLNFCRPNVSTTVVQTSNCCRPNVQPVLPKWSSQKNCCPNVRTPLGRYWNVVILSALAVSNVCSSLGAGGTLSLRKGQQRGAIGVLGEGQRAPSPPAMASAATPDSVSSCGPDYTVGAAINSNCRHQFIPVVNNVVRVRSQCDWHV